MNRFDFGVRICEALGIDSLTVTSVTIDVDAGSLPTVVVTFLPDGHALDAVTEIVKRYTISPKADA